MVVVFAAYLVIGLAMPVVPLHVHADLGLDAFVVGVVGGSPSIAAVLSRFWAGRYADSRGAKRAVVAGLLAAAAGGALYLLSLAFAGVPRVSVAILIAGRALLGAADGFIITGALTWGLALMGARNTGKIMAWVGSALWAAFAVGAPLGTALYSSRGFTAIALATIFLPLGALLLVVPLRGPKATQSGAGASMLGIARSVAGPGLALAFGGVGFGAVTTFIVLLYAEHGWSPAWLAFTTLSVAFMVGRVIFGDVPDRIGGAKVAFVSILIEAAGQVTIWLAPSSGVALAGVALSGLGYALVFPALGVEAIARAPAQSRGLAMGTYTAFLDVSLGLAGPVLGLIASGVSLSAVFLASALLALCGASLALKLQLTRKPARTEALPASF